MLDSELTYFEVKVEQNKLCWQRTQSFEKIGGFSKDGSFV
ncbi:unnamed protein product [marine sediment metagenome]|uniref:Uncharacterized protein n=1 Tax=marine sediment metagenome TaxID=412755 RepID=X0UL32_9ZZZZ